MNANKLNQLKALLQVPTHSFREQQMVAYLKEVLAPKGVCAWSDVHNNVYVQKGSSDKPVPCLAAHIDSVQPLRQVQVLESGDFLRGSCNDQPAGLGADDKTGIFVCLELLDRFDDIALMLCASEEVGCHGAFKAREDFFDNAGYIIEFDCPSRQMVSHTVSGVRLFANQGDFIRTALPVLHAHGSTLWQNHPYTDVMALRQRFPLSCLNLSSGYYNWHADNEFVKVSDVDRAIEQGEALVRALGRQRYPFPCYALDEDEPLLPVGPLQVPSAV